MKIRGLLLMALLVAGNFLAAPAAAQRPPRPAEVLSTPLEPKPDVVTDKALIDDTAAGTALAVTVTVSKRWIGVLCKEVDETLRAHLDIPEGTGIAVQQVVPDSPAEEAGLQQHDILLKVDGQRIKDVQDLVQGVSDADEDGISLTWLHHGREVTKSIQPAERPKDVQLAWVPDRERDMEFSQSEATKNLLDALRLGGADRLKRPMRMRVFGPGIEVPEEGTGLPADLRIEIQKEGKQPAKITVQQGNNKWEVTEDNLDGLPADVRSHVEGMLGGGLGRQQLGFEFQPLPIPEELRELNIPLPRLEKRFDEMNRRMEQMFEELKRLKGGDNSESDEFNPDTDA